MRCVSVGRLDNRPALCDLLGVDGQRQSSMSDSELFLRGYQKWGIDGPQYFLGDWAFVVWDPRDRRLFTARDHFGHCGLYYYHDSRQFVVSTSLAKLLKVPGVRCQLNALTIAQTSRGFRRDDSTGFVDVRRLPLACSLLVTESDVHHGRYWHPANAKDVRCSDSREYLKRFRAIYDKAVSCRLEGPGAVGVTLSGGLDSGSTAAIASKTMANTGAVLPAFTSVPMCDTSLSDRAGQFGNERPMVEMLQRHCGDIDVTYIDALNTSPVQCLRKALGHCLDPHLAVGNVTWLIEMMAAARRKGINRLLTGHAGNLTASWAGNRDQLLRRLLKSGRLIQYVQEITRWKQVHQTGIGHTLFNQVGRSVLPQRFLRNRNARIAKGESGPLNQSFLDQVRKTAAPSPICKYMQSAHSSSAHRKLYAMMLTDHNSAWSELGASFGIEFATPVLDVRLMEFCLGIPQSEYTKNGQRKLLIRRAMKGLMPKEFLWTEKRGRQGADSFFRAQRHRDELEATLTDLSKLPTANEVLNLSLMRDCLGKLDGTDSPENSRMIVHVLLKGILIGLFIQRVESIGTESKLVAA